MMASVEQLLPRLEKALALMCAKAATEQRASLDEMAQAAALSKYHFHRVYSLIFGETCKQTQLRLQLLNAGQLLASSGFSAEQAAWKGGFSSAQALSKVLQNKLNTNATLLRQDPERLGALLQELQQPVELISAPYRIYLTELGTCRLVSLTTEGSYPELNQHYEQLFQFVAPQTEIQAILGVAWQDLDADVDQVRFDCALLTSGEALSLPSDLQQQSITQARYLVYRHQGSYSTLGQSIDVLYAFAVTEEFELADLPCVHHYLDDPEQVEVPKLRTDLYLPVLLNK